MGILVAQARDEAGPLWVLFENFVDSWPIKPKRVLLAVVVISVIVWLVAVLSKRRKP
jgi:hypothetical protein